MTSQLKDLSEKETKEKDDEEEEEKKKEEEEEKSKKESEEEKKSGSLSSMIGSVTMMSIFSLIALTVLFF